MLSKIEQLNPGRFMSFKHLGAIIKGIDQPSDEESKKWEGAMENYHLHEKDGITELTIEIDSSENEANYFQKTNPIALERVKEISEGG